MKTEEYQLFAELLFFDNHLQDDKANYVVIADDYLFRRDSARIVAYRLEEKIKESKHFLLDAFGKEGGYDVQLNQENILLTATDGSTQEIVPMEVPYRTNSIQILAITDFDWEATVDTKTLVKALLIIQRKIMNQPVDMMKINLFINFQEKTINLQLKEETVCLALKMDIKQTGNNPIVYYAYPLFKDFFMNAKSLNSTVSIRVHAPYFTRIDYTEKIMAVLNHKRINQEIM